MSTLRLTAKVMIRRTVRQFTLVVRRVVEASVLHRRQSISEQRVDNDSITSTLWSPAISKRPSDDIVELQVVSETRSALRPKLRTVDRADRLLLAVKDTYTDHRCASGCTCPVNTCSRLRSLCAPLGSRFLRSVVTEDRRHLRLLVAGVDHRPRRPVLHPGQDRVLLDPAEGGVTITSRGLRRSARHARSAL